MVEGTLEGDDAGAAQDATDAQRDDVSVPPVDIDSPFFDAPAHMHEAPIEVEGRDPRAALKRSPAAAKRRAELTKYVTATMGVALALCVAALVKSAVAGNEPPRPSHGLGGTQAASLAAPGVNTAATTESAPSPPAAPLNSAPADTAAPTEKPAEQAVAAQAPTEPAAPSATAAPAPSEAMADLAQAKAEVPGGPSVAEAPAVPPSPAPPQAPAPVAAAPASPPAVAPPAATAPASVAPAAAGPAQGQAVVASGGDAKSEKEKARGALERGRLGDAIQAGERSVALDPSDAEGWLILGAAYLQRGDAKNSSRAFKSCIDRSSHGPKGECAAMLR